MKIYSLFKSISKTKLTFYLGFIFLPFYFFPSGGPQIATFFFILSGVFTFRKVFIKFCEKSFLNIFFVYTLLINLSWYIYTNESSFLSSISQLFFGLFIYYLSSLMFNDLRDKGNHLLRLSLFFLPVFYVFLYFRGLGAYDFGFRYNGYFNDPNQMAFYFLMLSIFILKIKFNNPTTVFLFFCSVFLVFLTLSRSALIPIILLSILFLFRIGLIKRILMLSALFVLFYFKYSSILQSDFLNLLLSRFDYLDFNEIAEERGINHLESFDIFSLFGRGQGGYSRFNNNSLEIHNSIVAYIVYYGLFGFMLFLGFLHMLYKKQHGYDFIYLLAILIFSMFTFAFRTPIFWMTLAFLNSHKYSGVNMQSFIK